MRPLARAPAAAGASRRSVLAVLCLLALAVGSSLHALWWHLEATQLRAALAQCRAAHASALLPQPTVCAATRHSHATAAAPSDRPRASPMADAGEALAAEAREGYLCAAAESNSSWWHSVAQNALAYEPRGGQTRGEVLPNRTVGYIDSSVRPFQVRRAHASSA